MSEPGSPRGYLAGFRSGSELLAAVRRVRDAGYREIEAYAPMPVAGLRQALGRRASRLGWLVLAGCLLGATAFYFLEWYSAVIAYPINIGGRPLHSWPAFLFPALEMTLLSGSVFGVVGMLLASRLRLYDPLFGVPAFDAATRDGYFLYVVAQADPAPLARLLESLQPASISEVGP